MSRKQNDINLGRVQGYLEAFALFNTKTNHNCSFEFNVLHKNGSAERTLQEHYSEICGIHPHSLKLSPLTQVEQELQTALNV